MDDSGKTKYPVLFQVYAGRLHTLDAPAHDATSYGGPGSQQVNQKFNVDWHYFLACYHKYIIVTVDGRGTGFRGRKLRNPVKDNLGHWETVDQVNAAK